MKRKNIIAAGVTAAVALAACASVAFIDKAREFAIGTWNCEMNHLEVAAAVQADGKALFQFNHGDVFEFSWKLDGTKVIIGGPKNTRLAAEVDVTRLEDGEITHTDTTPKGDGQIIGGGPASVSNVAWDFEKKTVSFQAEGLAGVPANTMLCHKTSSDVTLKATPTTQVMPETKSLKDFAATLDFHANKVMAASKANPAAAWFEVVSKLSTYVPVETTPHDLSITFVTGTQRTLMRSSEWAVHGPALSAPERVELSAAGVKVCMTPTAGTRVAMVLDGPCQTPKP